MFVIVEVALIFVMSVFFRVSDIEVNGNVHYTDSEIIRAIDIEEGDNLFFFDRFAALSRVFAKLPYIEEVTVERKLPNKVIIDVTESTALAYLSLGDENWTIDHNCKVLGKASEDELSNLTLLLSSECPELLQFSASEEITYYSDSGGNGVSARLPITLSQEQYAAEFGV